MSNVKVALADITNRVLNTSNNNEGWIVTKMRLEYTNMMVVILPIIYQKDEVQYFNNKYVMMISKADHGKFVNWVTNMYS